jgi:3-hydroxyisobutyrate dehydrogenase
MNASTSLDIAWIGAGVMGASMAGHLLDAGHRITVHTRTRAKAEPLLARGAAWADTPGKAADGCAVAFSIVGMPADVEAVHLGLDGTLAADRPPGVIVDMTTSAPDLAERIAAAAAERGVGSVDAPVSGGDVGARDATLSIMVGGADRDVETVRPLLDVLGRRIVHQGPAGAGQHTKMVNQILIASTMIGVCEGLLYAARAGLDPEKVLASVGSGAAGSWTVDNLAPRMIARDFAPGFAIDHFVKDLAIALAEAERMGVSLPGLALGHASYAAARAAGRGGDGTHALLAEMEA